MAAGCRQCARNQAATIANHPVGTHEEASHTSSGAGPMKKDRRSMKRFVTAVLWVALLFPSTPVSAGLVLGIDASARGWWGSTTDIVITATNDGADDIYLSYFQFGLQILPDGAAGGSADITTLSLPSADSAWDNATSATTGPSPATLSDGTVINGSSDYWAASISSGVDPQSSLPLYGWIPQGQTRSLAVVTVAWTGNALDTTLYAWRLYAVNESPGLIPVTAMFNDAYDTLQFSNLQTQPESTDTASVTVANITVVPEPTGVTAVTALSVTLFVIARRRCRRSGRRPR